MMRRATAHGARLALCPTPRGYHVRQNAKVGEPCGERPLTEQEIDLALADQRHHLLTLSARREIRCAGEPARQVAGDRRQVQCPVERAVAAADDQNALVAERIHLAHRIEQRLAFIRLDAG